jgi:hypothetical protein
MEKCNLHMFAYVCIVYHCLSLFIIVYHCLHPVAPYRVFVWWFNAGEGHAQYDSIIFNPSFNRYVHSIQDKQHVAKNHG